MGKLKANLTMSLDGFVAGPNRSDRDALGVDGEQLHAWVPSLKRSARHMAKKAGRSTREPHSPTRILGNVSTPVVHKYLAAGLLDEIVVFLVPNFLAGGARLFDNFDAPKPRLRQVHAIEAPVVTHIRYARGRDQ